MWSFGHFINTDWLRKNSRTCLPEFFKGRNIPEWKENAEKWIGWILGKYSHFIAMLDERYRLQTLLQGASSCDRQVPVTFEEWTNKITRSDEPNKCLLPKEDMDKSKNRPNNNG